MKWKNISKEDHSKENNSQPFLILFSYLMFATHSNIKLKRLSLTELLRLLSVPRLESPTRSLLMEAPKGIQILAEAGDIQAICRNELRLESKDGEVGRPDIPNIIGRIPIDHN